MPISLPSVPQQPRYTLDTLTLTSYSKPASSRIEVFRAISLFKLDELQLGGTFDIATVPFQDDVPQPL